MRSDDDGFATIWVMIAMVIVGLMAAVAGGVGVVAVTGERARSAADASALAVALHVVAGPTAACAIGARLAHENDAVLRECRLSDADATVQVAVPLPGPLAGFGPAIAVARAGPVSEGPSSGGVGGLSPSTRR
ncbi:MAG TPA: Rv3654c family TadE-like protein [Mycobacteriales bacterium]|nr:Rv3654c family TadE-like protein [Mycobacteriales bacterium]